MSDKTRITRITVARLYNLGNYEHVRYELTADIAPGDNPSDVLANTVKVLRALDPVPPCTAYEYKTAAAAIAKVDAGIELSQWEKDSIPAYRTRIQERIAWKQRREEALRLLNQLGGTEVKTDAKLSWDEEDEL